jgi:hypothetical protein
MRQEPTMRSFVCDHDEALTTDLLEPTELESSNDG